MLSNMNGNYGCVEDCPKWKCFWIMIDLSNGHPGGRTYFWAFPTKKAALTHRQTQHQNPYGARLSSPIKISL